MRLLRVRPLVAALAAVAVTATLAGAQDADRGAPPRGSDDSLDLVRPPQAPEPQVRLAEPNVKTTAFRLPLLVFSAGAAADWSSTAWALRNPTSHENNPAIAWAKSPAAIIAAGAGIDAVGAYAWMKATGHHPKIQATGFLVAAAFRGYLAIQNIRNNRQPGGNRR
jgi:hypothetical protein